MEFLINALSGEELFGKLERDLRKLTTESVHEVRLYAYLTDLVQTLKSDSGMERNHKLTCLAAVIMMTAMNRHPGLAGDAGLRTALRHLLEAVVSHPSFAADCEDCGAVLDMLGIFAQGDTLAFLEKNHDIHEGFARGLELALAFLETEVCSGKIYNAQSNVDYCALGTAIMEMYRRHSTPRKDYVWYACYGSNLSRERFMRYIERCTDQTPPVEDRPFVFRHSIYFAKSTVEWDGGGKAFLDDTCAGCAYGRIYRITREQYGQVKRMEGRDYKKRLYLGKIDGFPVYSFTDTQKNEPERMPSVRYYARILLGMRQCCVPRISKAEAAEYLIRAIFPGDTFPVVRTVWENPHYLTNAQISSRTGLGLDRVTGAIAWLLEHGVMQQDRRSIDAGHPIDSPEAYFFTVDSFCARKLVGAMVRVLKREGK